jgi:hypothetical protein
MSYDNSNFWEDQYDTPECEIIKTPSPGKEIECKNPAAVTFEDGMLTCLDCVNLVVEQTGMSWKLGIIHREK